MRGRHGIAHVDDAGAAARGLRVHFGIALWPYDLALRFSYDLPENEHLWPGEWFDDAFEDAALDIRAAAAKLLHALVAMDDALTALRAAEADAGDLDALRNAVERAPLALDLVLHYFERILNDLGAVIPSCYGKEGKALATDRTSLRALAGSEALAGVDPALPALLRPDGAWPAGVGRFLEHGRAGVRTHQPDLYVVAGSAGYAASLPRATARALAANARVTLDAAAEVDQAIRDTCGWLDGLLAHLIAAVCARSDEGPDLQERWARDDWSVLAERAAPAPALERHLPALREASA